MEDKIRETLERKILKYKIVSRWFEDEYDSSTDGYIVEEWEKKGTELSAQIKVLRYLLGK